MIGTVAQFSACAENLGPKAFKPLMIDHVHVHVAVRTHDMHAGILIDRKYVHVYTCIYTTR